MNSGGSVVVVCDECVAEIICFEGYIDQWPDDFGWEDVDEIGFVIEWSTALERFVRI